MIGFRSTLQSTELVPMLMAGPPSAAQQQDSGGPIDSAAMLVEGRGRPQQVIPPFNVTIERLRGMEIHGARGDVIGEIGNVPVQ